MPCRCPEEINMGYDSRRIEITASVSRHNSENDALHDALWEDLGTRVSAIVNEPQYEEILAMISGNGAS
jgi:hypothetical protein